MAKQIKSIPMEMKLDEDTRIFEGYASTFGNKDFVDDIVVPGAFKKTIAERFPTRQIKVLYQHMEPLGMPIHMEEDSKGLYVKAKVSNTTLGNDVLELMRDGVIDRMSIGYDIITDEKDRTTNARLLKELKLYEFSPVTFPANDEAIISQVKSMNDLEAMLSKTVGGNLARFLKEGRVLSKSTYNKIATAIEALNEVLAAANTEDFEPPKGTHTSTANLLKDLDPLKLQSILQDFEASKKILGGK